MRVIDPEGNQLGIMPIEQALEEAQARGLDLIEVAPNSDPPVCRIMDWGKFKYEQQKKAREAHKKARHIEVKMIRVRPNTDEHDIAFKMRNARRFIEKGHKVKFNVIFRGPELRHKEIGERQLQKFIDGLADIAKVEQEPHMEGRQMIMVLEPQPHVLQALQEKKAAEEAAKQQRKKAKKAAQAAEQAQAEQPAQQAEAQPAEAQSAEQAEQSGQQQGGQQPEEVAESAE